MRILVAIVLWLLIANNGSVRLGESTIIIARYPVPEPPNDVANSINHLSGTFDDCSNHLTRLVNNSSRLVSDISNYIACTINNGIPNLIAC